MTPFIWIDKYQYYYRIIYIRKKKRFKKYSLFLFKMKFINDSFEKILKIQKNKKNRSKKHLNCSRKNKSQFKFSTTVTKMSRSSFIYLQKFYGTLFSSFLFSSSPRARVCVCVHACGAEYLQNYLLEIQFNKI